MNAYYFSLFHIFFIGLLPVFISIFSNNINILLFIIFWWFSLIFSWYIFGKCIFVEIENKLLNNSYQNIWLVEELKKKNETLGKLLFYIIQGTPVIFIIVALIKIRLICKKS